jgi:hypothetical protein
LHASCGALSITKRMAGLVQPQKGEMVCPLCQTPSNAFVPRGIVERAPKPVAAFDKCVMHRCAHVHVYDCC